MKFSVMVGNGPVNKTIKFWWRSRTDSPDGGTDIETLVRRALAAVCTIPVLLVTASNSVQSTKCTAGVAVNYHLLCKLHQRDDAKTSFPAAVFRRLMKFPRGDIT